MKLGEKRLLKGDAKPRLPTRDGARRPNSAAHPAKVAPLSSAGHHLQSWYKYTKSNLICHQSIPSPYRFLATGEFQGSSMRRLQTVLRLLRVALEATPLPDFDVRLCVDDFCHGLHERRPVPWLTSVSCLTQPSIPMVQWNTLPGRDPDMAVWDEVQRARHPA